MTRINCYYTFHFNISGNKNLRCKRSPEFDRTKIDGCRERERERERE